MGLFDGIKSALGFNQPAPMPEPEPAPGGVFGDHRITEDGYLVRNEYNFSNYMHFKELEDDLPRQRCNYDTTVNVDMVEGLNQLTRTDPFTGQKEYITEDRFWNQHGYDKENYLNIASHVPEINDKLEGLSGEEAGRVIAGLKNDQDENVRLCADMYFNPNYSQRIHAVRFGDQYEIDGGRHRVEALAEVKEMDRMKAIQNGQEFDESRYNLPVTVTGHYQMPGHSMGVTKDYKIEMPSMFASQTEERGPGQPYNPYAAVPSEKMSAGEQQKTGPASLQQGSATAPNTGNDQDIIRRPEPLHQEASQKNFRDAGPQNVMSMAPRSEPGRDPMQGEGPDRYKGPDLAPSSEPGRDPMQGEGPDRYKGPDLAPRSEPGRNPMQGEGPDRYKGPDLAPRSEPGRGPMHGEGPDRHKGPDLTPRTEPDKGPAPSGNTAAEERFSPSNGASHGIGSSLDSAEDSSKSKGQSMSM